jgi:hypothetical protein
MIIHLFLAGTPCSSWTTNLAFASAALASSSQHSFAKRILAINQIIITIHRLDIVLIFTPQDQCLQLADPEQNQEVKTDRTDVPHIQVLNVNSPLQHPPEFLSQWERHLPQHEPREKVRNLLYSIT